MAVLITNISSTFRAYDTYEELYQRNKGRVSWSNYIYLKMLKSGKYQIGVTESEPKGKGLIKVNKL